MSRETLQAAHYRLPERHEHQHERCRDCQEKTRAAAFGNAAHCRRHQASVRHSHRCDDFHERGTLL